MDRAKRLEKTSGPRGHPITAANNPGANLPPTGSETTRARRYARADRSQIRRYACFLPARLRIEPSRQTPTGSDRGASRGRRTWCPSCVWTHRAEPNMSPISPGLLLDLPSPGQDKSDSSSGRRPTTLQRDRDVVRIHLKPVLGALQTGRIEPIHVREVVQCMSDRGLSRATARRRRPAARSQFPSRSSIGWLLISPRRGGTTPPIWSYRRREAVRSGPPTSVCGSTDRP